jgi:hypothetical protein
MGMSQDRRDAALPVCDIDRRLDLLATLRLLAETDAQRAAINAEIDRLEALRRTKSD